jgi:hypothetical protein
MRFLLPSLAAAALTAAVGIAAPGKASAQALPVQWGYAAPAYGYAYAPPPPPRPAYGYGYGWRPWHPHHWGPPAWAAPRPYWGPRW